MLEDLMITKITKQSNKQRYNIYINDEYLLSVDEEILISQHLYKGKIINQDFLDDIRLKGNQNKAWNKTLRYLSLKSRSEDEIKKYLIKNNYTEEVIEQVVNKLKIKGYINDMQYAKSFVNHQISSKYISKKLLAYKLKNKGISDIDVKEALKEYNDQLEYKMALNLIKNKYKEIYSLEWHIVYNKVANFLQRRGFSYNTIIKVLEEYKTRYDDKKIL